MTVVYHLPAPPTSVWEVSISSIFVSSSFIIPTPSLLPSYLSLYPLSVLMNWKINVLFIMETGSGDQWRIHSVIVGEEPGKHWLDVVIRDTRVNHLKETESRTPSGQQLNSSYTTGLGGIGEEGHLFRRRQMNVTLGQVYVKTWSRIPCTSRMEPSITTNHCVTGDSQHLS
jgi:hypothetical protein